MTARDIDLLPFTFGFLLFDAVVFAYRREWVGMCLYLAFAIVPYATKRWSDKQAAVVLVQRRRRAA
jgi:hypothetical protein